MSSIQQTWNALCDALHYPADLKASGWNLLQRLHSNGDALGEQNTQVRAQRGRLRARDGRDGASRSLSSDTARRPRRVGHLGSRRVRTAASAVTLTLFSRTQHTHPRC